MVLAGALLALPLHAQVVRGRVVDAESGSGIAGALVELRDSAQGLHQTISRSSGSFSIDLSRGSYRYRVIAIGYLPRVTMRLVVGDSSVAIGMLSLTRTVVSLPELVATSKKRFCGATDREDPAFARLLESVRSALAVMEATVTSRGLAFDVVYTHRASQISMLSPRARTDTVIAPMRSWPVRSLALDSLQQVGFSRLYTPREGVGRWYFGPDLRVLSSDWFLDSHCFTLAVDRGKSDTLRLRFQPAAKSSRIDLSGELVIDRDSLSLRRLDFRHENLPFWIAGRAGGTMTFEHEGSGLWLPARWAIWAPIEFQRRATREDTMTINGATVQLARVPGAPALGQVEDAGAVVEVRAGEADTADTQRDVVRITHLPPADSNRVTTGAVSSMHDLFSAPEHHPNTTGADKAQRFPPVERPGNAFDIPTLIEHSCPVGPRVTLDSLRKREASLNDAAQRGHRAASDWTALGCARAQLATREAISREGVLMVTGSSWAQGAINAMLEALGARHDEPVAAEVLAILSMRAAEPSPRDAIAAAIRDAVMTGISTPAVLRACTELALRRDDVVGSRNCANQALARGMDSTWQLIRLARLGAREHDSAAAVRLFERAAAVAHDSFARAEVDWHLQWFLSPEERRTWIALPDTARGRWVHDRLLERDVRDGQPAGARLSEHFKRLEFVEANFRLNVPKVMRNSLRTCCLREYVRWQVDFDDRGVVYMRFGPPDLVAADAGIWKYVIDGRPMFLEFIQEDFDGSSGDTRLDVGLMGAFWCSVDAYRCFLSNLTQSGHQFTPEMRDKLKAEDRQFITQATTADDNSPRGIPPIDLISRVHRMWDPVTGAPIALVSYAIGLKNLGFLVDSSLAVSAVTLQVRQWAPGADAPLDSVVMQRLQWPINKPAQAFATGFLVVNSSEQASGWSVTARQNNGDKVTGFGRAWEEGRPPLVDGPLGLSDLVIGVPGQGLSVKTGSREIVLAPLNTVTAADTVHLYYQVRNDSAYKSLHTTVALRSLDRPPTDAHPALQLESSDAVQPGLHELERTLLLNNLSAGRYRLEVIVSDERKKHTVRQVVLLEIRE